MLFLFIAYVQFHACTHRAHEHADLAAEALARHCLEHQYGDHHEDEAGDHHHHHHGKEEHEQVTTQKDWNKLFVLSQGPKLTTSHPRVAVSFGYLDYVLPNPTSDIVSRLRSRAPPSTSPLQFLI